MTHLEQPPNTQFWQALESYLESQKVNTCTHPALRFLSPQNWQCAICGQEVTDVELLNQKNERRSGRKVS